MSVASLNAMDPRSLNDLKRLTREGDSPEALRAAAQQFEAVFMQMVFKAMREATPSDGLFDSEQTRMFQQLHDQQIAGDLATGGGGTGLAEAIFRQLGGEAMEQRSGNTSVGPDGRTYFDLSDVIRRPANPAVRSASAAEKGSPEAAEIAAPGATRPSLDGLPDHVGSFVGQVWDHAVDAGRKLGVPTHFVVAQAALETGWGRAELRRADGSPSHNLFNVKAGSGWRGEVVELPVTEYTAGRAITENARFRAYDSYAEAFDDYVALLSDNPRYAGVIGQQDAAAFAGALQKAGYATDPQYADKLQRVIGDRLQAVAGSFRTSFVERLR